MNGQAACGLFSAHLAQTNQGAGAKAWPGGGVGGGLGFSQLSSALWASFLLALGQKGLVNCAGSIPSLGVLRGPELLQEAQARSPCISCGLPSWPYRLCGSMALSATCGHFKVWEAGAWRQRRCLGAWRAVATRQAGVRAGEPGF